MRTSTEARGMRTLVKTLVLYCLYILLFLTITPSSSVDTISTAQSIKDGLTIVSAGGVFELEFFSPGNSKNRYVGIWYNKISPLTTVWVANRDFPLVDNSGSLTLTHGGILMLLNGTNGIIWHRIHQDQYKIQLHSFWTREIL